MPILFLRRLATSTAPARSMLALMAAVYATLFIACASLRLGFGFETSWMESGMEAMTARLRDGAPLYAAPSTTYVPFIYPPLYFHAAHLAGAGLDIREPFLAMRLVSLVATLGTALVIWAVLRRRAGTGGAAVLLAMLSLAFYGRFEFWHDTSRVDSLFVLLLFAALALLCEGRGLGSAAAAGAFGGLAALTKQPALALLGACGLVLMVRERSSRRVGVAAGAGVATLVAGLALMGDLGNRWLAYYVVEVPARHGMLAKNVALGVAFVALTMPLFFVRAWRAAHSCREARGPRVEQTWAVMFLVIAAVMLALRAKRGASINFFLPLVPVGLVVVAPALRTARGTWLVVAQFAILAYDPTRAIPSAADWRAGFELLQAVRALPGPVFLPQFPAYLTMAGKPAVAHCVAMCDLAELRPDLFAEIEAQHARGLYAAAFPWPHDPRRPAICESAGVARHYRPLTSIPRGGDFFTRSHGPKLGGLAVHTSFGVARQGP